MLPSSGGTTPRAPRRVRARLVALGAAGALAVAAAAVGSALAIAAPAQPPVAVRLVQPVQLPYFPPTRILKQGMSGSDVLALEGV